MKACAMVATALVLVAGGPLLSAQQAAPEPPPQFRSGVEVVNVDVTVIDRQGAPIRGLTPADFTVTVGGQQRRVVTAEYVEAADGGAEAAPEVEPAISTNEGGGGGRMF